MSAVANVKPKQVYYLTCCWMESGHVSVEASSPEEAREIAQNMVELPIDSAYIDESFRILSVAPLQ